MSNNKGGLKLKGMLVLFALVPLITVILILSIITINVTGSSMEKLVKEELKVACQGLYNYNYYDLSHPETLVDGFVEYDTEYVDSMGSCGVDLTLFKENIRFVTSIKDASGKRIEGTPASDAVWASVSAGNDYYSDDVKINNTPYYVYYMPIKVDGKVIGMAFAGKTQKDVKQAKNVLVVIVVVTAVILIVVFTTLALIISQVVANPIKSVAENLEDLANGNTDVKVTAKTHIHETGMLLDATKKLCGILNESIGKIRTEADALKGKIASSSQLAKTSSEGTEQISESMAGLAQTTETMAESVQEINVNVISMGEMIEGVVSNTENLNSSSANMTQANNEASECIKNMTSSSKKSLEAIESITEKIVTTNESVQKIDEMTSLITNIASQTNLLALNASIEAARAGEAGKGFGVVAEEIKNLAEQSNQSAAKIRDVVSMVSAQSSECVEESREVKDIINEEQKLLEVTLEKFEVLNDEINSSVNEINSISSVTSQLDKIKGELLSAVSDLSAISEETAATNQEVTASIESIAGNVKQVSDDSDHMNDLSDGLKDAIAYFK
jgi:methyl-accepting chemotaxis protein